MTTDVTPAAPKTEAELQAEATAVAEKSRADALAAGEGTPVDAIVPTIQERPEGVPEKFWDVKTGQVNYVEWNKAHTELETKFHESGKTDEEKAADKAAADAAAAGTPAPSGDAVADAQAEFAKDGKLADATYETLAKQGLDRPTVDAYIEGQTTRVTAMTTAAHDAAGGQEKYTEMVTWAADNLSDSEREQYNMLVNSQNPEIVKVAVEGLAKNFAENATVDGERLSGDAPLVLSGVFESKAEMTAAIGKQSESVKGKTQYEVDPAYRAAVQKKVLASRKAGKNIFI